LKALLESFDRMHEMSLVAEVDVRVLVKLVTTLLSCEHYVVIMFTLRWIYDCLDFLWTEHRAAVTGMQDVRSAQLVSRQPTPTPHMHCFSPLHTLIAAIRS